MRSKAEMWLSACCRSRCGRPRNGSLCPGRTSCSSGCQGREAGAGLQPSSQRIGLRLCRIDADIGRDPGQNLVAGNHDPVRPERRMVRRMAVAKPHRPVSTAKAQRLPFADGAKAHRDRRHALGEVEGRLRRIGLQSGTGYPGPLAEGDMLWPIALLMIEREHPGKQPGGPGGKDLGALIGEMAEQADMVRVVMRDEHPRDRFRRQRARQQRVPGLAAGFPVEPGIDERPAIRVFEDVDIHMVERHGQGQPHPEDALRHGAKLPRLRRGLPGKAEPRIGSRGHIHEASASASSA